MFTRRRTLGLVASTLMFPHDTLATTGVLLIENQDDVVIRDREIDGGLSTLPTWQEHRHAIVIRNSRNVLIENVTFRNLSGDGVYITGGSEGVVIHNNTFLGSHQNRNGVSIISGIGIEITGNTFQRMARHDMPGAIDLEPNIADETIRDVCITGNHIRSRKKNGTLAGILVYNAKQGTIENITIADNTIRGGMKYGVLVREAPNVTLGRNTIKGVDKERVRRV